MQNKKIYSIKNRRNLKVWILMVGILIFTLIVLPCFLDIKTERTIRNDIMEVESLLRSYLKNDRKISEGLQTEIELETKLISRQIYDSQGIIESINLDKDYYRIPGLINILVSTSLEGDFICDVEGNVYYINNRALVNNYGLTIFHNNHK